MKTRITFLAIQLIGMIPLANAIDTSTSRNNYFCDINDSNITFKPANDIDWYSITDGQPFDEQIQNVSDKANCLNIKAGRKNSTKNVKWVKEKFARLNLAWDDNYATSSSYAFDNMPKQLNFAIMGTLIYKFGALIAICDNVIIAQGHKSFGVAHNLWLFNNTATYKHSLKCTDPTGLQTIYLKVNSSQYPEIGDQFYLRPLASKQQIDQT